MINKRDEMTHQRPKCTKAPRPALSHMHTPRSIWCRAALTYSTKCSSTRFDALGAHGSPAAAKLKRKLRDMDGDAIRILKLRRVPASGHLAHTNALLEVLLERIGVLQR